MHYHISALHFVVTGLYVMLWLTMWRLVSAKLTLSKSPMLSGIGKAMAWQG